MISNSSNRKKTTVLVESKFICYIWMKDIKKYSFIIRMHGFKKYLKKANKISVQ